jgi:hypothetical protein
LISHFFSCVYLKTKFVKELRESEARALLYEVKQRRGQSLKQLTLEIEQTMKRAFLNADSRIRDTPMVEAFLQAIYDVDVKLDVRLSKLEQF